MSHRWIAPLAAATLAAACGGGGGGSPAAVASPPPAPAPAPGPAPAPPPSSAATTPVIGAPAPFADGLSGMQSVSATTSNAASVEFQIDDIPIATVAAAPYAAQFDADLLANGQHVLRARARDAAGQPTAWSVDTLRVASGRDIDAGFTKTEGWVSGLTRATSLTQATDGRLFVTEQGGTLRVVKDGVLLDTPAVRLSVDSVDERGLLGVALHPNFASNGWIYLYYTVLGESASHNRISRFVLTGDVSDGSEKVIADLPDLLGDASHNGGALHFGVDGKLYVGVGDNHTPARAQNVSDPLGKMLRFNDDGSIPADNPFCQAPIPSCAVWAVGLRNPFTFAVQPGSGRILINDVGESTWEEIDDGHAGANYGWPTFEGPTDASGSTVAPIFAYAHQPTDPPGTGTGGFFTGIAIVGAGFYPDAGPFPAPYRGNYFFADFGRKWVARLDVANGNAAYAFASVGQNPVDLLVGADGALYVLSQTSLTRITSP